MSDRSSVFTLAAEAMTGYPRRLAQSALPFIAERKAAAIGALRGESAIHWLALVAIVIGGLALRIALLDRPMDYDESVTFTRFAVRPFAEALSRYDLLNNHPLNTALIRLAYLAFGAHAWVVRLPALTAGVLMIPAAYAAGRTLYNANAGLLAAALTATTSYLMLYSISGRGYTLLVLFFLQMLTLASLLKKKWNAFGALLLGLAGVLMVYTIPIGVYPLAVTLAWLGASMLVERRAEITADLVVDGVAAAAVLGGIILLLYVPLLSGSLGVSANPETRFLAPQGWAEFFGSVPIQAWRIWDSLNTSIPVWTQWVLAGGVIAALALHGPISRDRLPVLVVAAVVLAVVTLGQRFIPARRTWIYLHPLYFVTAAAGLVAVGGWVGRRIPTAARAWMGAGVPVLVAAYLGWLTFSEAHAKMWFANPVYDAADAIALQIGGDIGAGDAILSLSKDYPSIRFYLFEHFGADGVDYANWTQISRGGIKPGRVYIIVIVRGGVPEGPPEDGMRNRGLDPAEYTAPEVLGTYPDVVLFVAQRK